MATVKAVLNKDREKKKGGYSLVIRIIHKRRHRVIYTPFVLKDEEFDVKTGKAIYTDGRRFTRKQINEINVYATQKKYELEKLIEKLIRRKKNFDIHELLNEYQQDRSNQYLIIFIDRLIEKRLKANKMGQAKAFSSTLTSLKKFIGDRPIMFNDITYMLVQEYGAYLSESGIKENSISYYMRNFRVIYNTAINSGVEMRDQQPFGKIRIRHGRTVKRALKKEVIEQIANYCFSDSPDLERARDLFMFSFYARGMSFVDVICLKKENIVDGVIYYQRQKTHRQMQVTLTPQLQLLINKYPSEDEYLFPFLNASNYLTLYQRYLIAYGDIYRHLKKVQKRLGISTSLTIHVARHSWATIAKLSGASIEAIRHALGHDSEKTTEIYLKELDNSEVDAVNEKVGYFQPIKSAMNEEKIVIFAGEV